MQLTCLAHGSEHQEQHYIETILRIQPEKEILVAPLCTLGARLYFVLVGDVRRIWYIAPVT